MKLQIILFLYCVMTLVIYQLFNNRFYNAVYLDFMQEYYAKQDEAIKQKVDDAKSVVYRHYAQIYKKEDNRVLKLAEDAAKNRVQSILNESILKCNDDFIYLFRGLGWNGNPAFIRVPKLYNYHIKGHGGHMRHIDHKGHIGQVEVKIELVNSEHYDEDEKEWDPFTLSNNAWRYLEYDLSYEYENNKIKFTHERKSYDAGTLEKLPASHSFCKKIAQVQIY